jgi:SWIM zinc finger.
MGLLSMASNASAWRGYEYSLNKNVISYKKISEYEYEAQVKGSNEENYSIFIDIEHPRKSNCNCPHAFGTRIICKHMIALYFKVLPSEAKRYIKEIDEYEVEEEQREQEMHVNVAKYIDSLSKAELQQVLTEVLYDSPKWVFDRFVRYRVEE